MTGYTLYHCDRSRSVRARWVLEEAAIDYRLVTMPLEHRKVGGDTYRAIHPLQKIPALDLGDETMLFESMAILDYIAARHAPHLRATEADEDFARFLQWLHFPEGTLGQYINQYLGHTLILPEPMRQPAMADWAKGEIMRAMDFFASALSDGPFILQRGFTILDIGMGYHCYLLALTRLMGTMPDNVQAYWQRLSERPAWKTSSAPTLT